MSSSGFQFGKIDAAARPASFVRYLDVVGPVVAAHKRLLLELQRAQPGDTILDVGCGTGEDALELAAHVGRRGRVLGVDNSRTMIEQARHRAEGSSLPVEFRVDDAHALNLPDEMFDGCRAERVFQHLTYPERALAELVRVARPGARIIIGDPDWDTLTVSASDRLLTRRIAAFLRDGLTSGGVAHVMPNLMRRIGMRNVNVVPSTLVLEQYAPAGAVLQLDAVLAAACAAGALTEQEAEQWQADLRTRDADGSFFVSITGFISVGIRP